MMERSRPLVRLFSPDLDGTLLGNAAAEQRFKLAWEWLPRDERPLLVFNSGRSVNDVRTLVAAGRLPTPDYIIGGVGTELYDVTAESEVRDFGARFGAGWNLRQVEAIMRAVPGAERQPPEFRHRYKSSWYLAGASDDDLEALRQRFAAAGLEVTLVYSSGRDLDVLPSCADKGKALQWLCYRLLVRVAHVLVAGDSANDTAMFLLPDVQGIVVGNAYAELTAVAGGFAVFHSRRASADGVLEGLAFFGVLGAPSSPESVPHRPVVSADPAGIH